MSGVVSKCKECGETIYDEQTVRGLCGKCKEEIVDLDKRIAKMPQWAQHEFRNLQCLNRGLSRKIAAMSTGGPIIHDPFHHPIKLENCAVRFMLSKADTIDVQITEEGMLRVSATKRGLLVLPGASNVIYVRLRKD